MFISLLATFSTTAAAFRDKHHMLSSKLLLGLIWTEKTTKAGILPLTTESGSFDSLSTARSALLGGADQTRVLGSAGLPSDSTWSGHKGVKISWAGSGPPSVCSMNHCLHQTYTHVGLTPHSDITSFFHAVFFW